MKTTKKISFAAAVVVAGFALTTVSASALTASTTITSTLGSVISVLTTSGTVNLDVTPTGAGAQTVSSDSVQVSTNDTSGYTLQLSTTGASTPLTDASSHTIPAASGTYASPAAITNNTWGYRIDGAGGFGAGPTSGAASTTLSSAKYAGVPASSAPVTIKTTSGTATNDPTSVWYTVAANTSQPNGTYTNSVTYTAVAN